MIGSYSRSYSGSESNVGSGSDPVAAQSGDTYCIGCSVNVQHVAIISSFAASFTKGKLCDAFC